MMRMQAKEIKKKVEEIWEWAKKKIINEEKKKKETRDEFKDETREVDEYGDEIRDKERGKEVLERGRWRNRRDEE